MYLIRCFLITVVKSKDFFSFRIIDFTLYIYKFIINLELGLKVFKHEILRKTK